MQLFKKANRLDPGQTDAIWVNARMLTTIGQMQQAHELLDLNAQATSSTLNAYDLSNSYAEYYYYNHNYQKSLAYIDSASTIWPKLMSHMQSRATLTPYALSRLVFWQYPLRGQLYTLIGKPLKARALMQKAITLLNTSPTHELRNAKINRLYSLALCQSINGEFKKAVVTINKAIQLSPVTEHYSDYYFLQEALSEIYARAGDADKAIPILQQVFKARGTGIIITAHILKNDPFWNPIRKDPRFQALIRQYIGKEVLS
jgi:tetratricopeptide (TPR) repeat protein